MDGADSGIYVVPALGGPERKLRSTQDAVESFSLGPLVSWSPDGKWIAFSDVLPADDHAKIYLLSTESGETKRLPNSPKCLSEADPAFSHNGESLAFWCLQSFGESSLYSLPLAGGEAKMILHMRELPYGLAWSASDKELIYSPENSSELQEVTLSNGSVRRLALTYNGMWPTISSKGDKLAYGSSFRIESIWRRDLLHPESPAVEVDPSTRPQYSAQYSPDGTRIAFASQRSGVQGVWVSDGDGGNLVQLSNPLDMSGSPQWSPDGKEIAFDSRPSDHWEIYVADVAERIPRKLVTNISSVYRPHWSRDGQLIYFASFEIGRTGAYRCRATGGDAIALAKDIDGLDAQESFDGLKVYFVNRDQPRATLKKLARLASPGTESEVDGLPSLNGSELWTLLPGGIYFVPGDSPRSLRYFNFATKQIRSIFELNMDFGPGLSVSPDGRWILYSQAGDLNRDVMLVDNFR
jgi:Tol biopolymer transport system component